MYTESLKKEGFDTTLKPIAEVDVLKLPEYDAILIGTPTYYGMMASDVKKFIDESIKVHKKLDGKVGAVFTTFADWGSGCETTLLSVMQTMLVHGMIVQGDPKDLHYGVAIMRKPGEDDGESIRRKARRLAGLLKRLKPIAPDEPDKWEVVGAE
jgi:NAD(P)H dehydrogenase (quinone)